MPVPSQGHYVFTVFRLLTDFVCLYTYEFWLSLCKIVRSSVILLLPLFIIRYSVSLSRTPFKLPWSIVNQETILSTYILNYKIFGTLFGFYCPFDFPVYVFTCFILLSVFSTSLLLFSHLVGFTTICAVNAYHTNVVSSNIAHARYNIM